MCIRDRCNTDRIRNDQRSLFSETTIEHVLVQSAGESSATCCNGVAVVIDSVPAFRTTAATSVDSNQLNVLAAPLNHFTQRAETSAQVRPHLDKPAARGKRAHG